MTADHELRNPRIPPWDQREPASLAFLRELLCGPMRRPIDIVFLVRLGLGVVLFAAGVSTLAYLAPPAQYAGGALLAFGLFLIVACLRWDNSAPRPGE